MGGHLFIQDGWKIFLRFVCPAERMRDGSAVPCIVKRGEPAGPPLFAFAEAGHEKRPSAWRMALDVRDAVEGQA